MTSKLEVVKAFTDGGIDLDRSAEILSDDFIWIDGQGNEENKQVYLGLGAMMVAAFPDLEFVRTGLREEGDYVIMTGHFKGTFNNDFDMSAMGFGVVPANGEVIEWPDADNKIKVEGAKIVHMQAMGDGGMAQFLAPLGLKIPAE